MAIENKEYRFLGRTGLRVSSISLGGWITYGSGMQVEDDKAKAIFDRAFKAGINFFDTAEGYGGGACETSMGNIINDLNWPRQDYVLSTKIYFGGKGINQKGLSRKHVMEAIDASLKRLRHDYVDIVFAHRPDAFAPMEEVVRAFTKIIEDGKAHYWGTSMWTAYEIEHAHHIATKYNLIPPVAEQPEYNLLTRDNVERELAPIFKEYGYGTTIFSPLATGLLTGKYSDPNNVPEGSRYDPENRKKDPIVEMVFKRKFQGENTQENFSKINQLHQFATELGVDLAALALAWVLKQPNIDTVIIGASRPEQIDKNIKAYEVLPKLTPDVLEKIDKIVNNRPNARDTFGRLNE